MKLRLPSLVVAVLLATVAHAQNMTPNYNFAQLLTTGANDSYYEVTEQVTGSTQCSGSEGCNGAMHYVQLEAKMGSDDAPYLSGDFIPTDVINYSTSAQATIPFTSIYAKLWGEVDCTVRGRFAAEGHPVGSANLNAYWESQITFFKVNGNPGAASIIPDCQFSGDTSPDWNPVLTNPANWPTYYQAINLAYASVPQPGQGGWTGFPYVNLHDYGGITGNYGIYGWYHLNGGAPAPMPHVCTQNQVGKTVYNPAWTPNPQ